MNCKNARWKLLSALICILGLFVEENCEIIEKPVDTEVRAGDSTYLNCSISDSFGGISWYHHPVDGGESHHKYVYFKRSLFEPYNERYRIEKDNSDKAFNLVITNVELQDAGLYVCQEEGRNGKRASAQLIVLESIPVCTTNIDASGFIGPNSCGLEQELIDLSCDIDYRGNIPPRVKWAKVEYKHENPSNEWDPYCSTLNNRITCNHTAPSDLEMDGASFTCFVTEHQEYKCRTPHVRIHYAINNKTEISKTVGDMVTCSANTSSTSCSYKWIWFDGVYEATMSESERLTITKDGWHRCQANCFIKNYQCSIDAMMIEAENFDTSGFVIVLAAGIIAFIIIASTVFIVIMYRRFRDDKKQKNEEKESKEKQKLRKQNSNSSITDPLHDSNKEELNS